MKRIRRGFALLELIIALAISASVMGGVYLAYSLSEARVTVDETNSLVRLIADQARAVYRADPNLYETLTLTALAKQGRLPIGLVIDGNTYIDTPGGERITIVPVSRGGVNNGGFKITLANANRQACVYISVENYESFGETEINSTSVAQTRTSPVDPLSRAEAGNACNDMGNQVVFYGG